MPSVPSASVASAFAAYRRAPQRRSSPDTFTRAPVVIYGAGNTGRDVYRLLAARGASVLGFLDRKAKRGDEVDGLPVWSPAAAAHWPSDTVAIIALFNPGADVEPIRRDLEHAGFSAVYTFLDVHDAFASELGDRFWLTHRDRYPDWEAEATQVADTWADEESRCLYAALLRFRLAHDYAALPAPSSEAQYFPHVRQRRRRPLRFVDCGAFDGDTLREVSLRGGAEAAAAFEPDLDNYRKLVQASRSLSNLGEVTLLPCAVADQVGKARFAASGHSGSSLSTRGEEVVTCVALDEALANFRPTFIKMDIEGAEVDALLGARRLIEAHQPELAICVYHRPEHLWQIPLLIQSWYGDAAHYYLRLYAHSGFETVFYAIPH